MVKPPEQTQATITVHGRYLKEGKHSAILHLPETFLPEIGLVIAHWGHFEMAFNASLEGLINGEKLDNGTRQTDGWKRLAFKRRRRLMKAICREWLTPWRPFEAVEIAAITDKSASLARKRNLIAHGTYVFTLLPMSDIAVNCRALNHETGQEMSRH